MKEKFKYIVAMVLVACMGCSDWLDVKPRTEMREDEVFQTEDGFKQALIGAYIQMASSDLYGKNMTMYFPEILAQNFKTLSYQRNTEYYIEHWDFESTNVESLIDGIWKAYYKVIVHLNNILGHIDEAKDIFSYGNYELVKGEALGLRAFLHLDLLRMFGPIPNEAASGKLAIPYAEEMSKDPNLFQTLAYAEVCEKIIRDLDAAEELLKHDPLVEGNNYDLNDWYQNEGEPTDDWQYFRQQRFNYYAVKGTKARYYHWIGDETNAVKYAKEVIDSEKFRLANENDYNGVNYDYENSLVMLSEHLFGLNVPDLQDIVQPLFKDEEPALSIEYSDDIALAYENSTSDIRNKPNRYWQTVNMGWDTYNYFLKYTGNDDVAASDCVPLLRLAEMYFILIEDSAIGTVNEYWRSFILARGLSENLEGTLTSEEAIRDRMEKEYRKEFMGEGQMFYFYKKHAYTAYSWPENFTVPQPDYEIPRPESQTIFD